MVAWLVNLVHKRRGNPVLSRCVCSMALGTLSLEYGFPNRGLLREICRQLDLNDWVACFYLTRVRRRHGMTHRCIFRRNELPSCNSPASYNYGCDKCGQFIHACVFRLACCVR